MTVLLPCRVQLVRVQEEQAEDGAGRKNGTRAKTEEEKATIEWNSECSGAASIQMQFGSQILFLSNTFFHSHTSIFVANLSGISNNCTVNILLSCYWRWLQSKQQYRCLVIQTKSNNPFICSFRICSICLCDILIAVSQELKSSQFGPVVCNRLSKSHRVHQALFFQVWDLVASSGETAYCKQCICTFSSQEPWFQGQWVKQDRLLH